MTVDRIKKHCYIAFNVKLQGIIRFRRFINF